MPDLLASARALDKEDVDLAIARSDVAPVDGQTLAILRRDAAIFIAPSGNAIDAVTKLRGRTVGVLGNDVPTVKLLDLILQHYDVDPASVRRVDLAPEQIADAVRHRKVAAVFALLRRTARGYRCCSPQFAEAATDRLRLSQWMRQRRLRSAIPSWKHSTSRRALSTAPFPRQTTISPHSP